MRSCLVLVVALAACSNNGSVKREDGAMPPPKPDGAKQPKVYIGTPGGEVTIAVEVVNTWPKIEKGLMFREHLPPDDGMLFFMGYEHDHAFYMRNTLIPLDMIFIAKDLTVGGVYENAEPRTETLRKVGVPTLYVLEVNGGYARAHGVIAGAKVRFEAMPPVPPKE